MVNPLKNSWDAVLVVYYLSQQCFDIVYVEFYHKPHHTILMTCDDDFGKERSKEMVVDM